MTRKTTKPEVLEAPITASLVLWGKCPAKKNLWRRGKAGHSFLDLDVKAQIDALTHQARAQWNGRGPVEHPELIVRMFIHHARRDQDGIYTTLLDCLQSAGILVNDNSAHNNGRKVLEPCQFVDEAAERVEIEIRKV